MSDLLDEGGLASDTINRFLDVARRHPSSPAVLCDGEALSYTSLERRVRLLARLFATTRAPSVLVALPPGGMAYAAMLAAGLAGGYYVPVNLSAPSAKIACVCRAVQPDIVIGEGAVLDMLGDVSPSSRRIDVASLDDADGALFEGAGTRHELAYMIFTSGSTGTPKGVVIARRSLDHYVDWIGEGIGIRAGDRVSQYANIAFDLSVLEIYGALCHGASLHPPTGQGDRLMPARIIEREQLTHWISVPSVAALMLKARQMDARHLASLERMIFCGEPLLAHQVAAIFEARPDLVVQNTYGPTEATVSMTSVLLTRDTYQAQSLGSISIGEPIRGMAIRLEGGPSEDEGEIVIIGPQLALGYHQSPERTAAAFRSECGVRRYHTGDWAERRDGVLFHRGRIDFQVKIKGYRIELDEIGGAIAQAGFADACVFQHEEALVAVVEVPAAAVFDAVALRRRLAGLIEPYAIPSTIEAIDRLPRNGNDKIDRGAVIAWFAERPAVILAA